MRSTLQSALLTIACLVPFQQVFAHKCLFVSSYHRGYEWSDRVEQGLRSVLQGRCELKQVDMDTKRHKDEAYKINKGKEIKALIEKWQPDVVVTADDNAAKYVIQPYFKDSQTPFVFCGVNWTAEEYGFPYRNVTGMVEVAPIQPMLKKAIAIAAPGQRAYYIGANTLTETKNLTRFRAAAAELGLQLRARLAVTTDDWLSAYREAQHSDFIILGSHSGINDWDEVRVRREIGVLSKKLSVTNHSWMMPYAMFGMTKVPEEHGRWGGETALAILQGTPPPNIPIIANRTWELWLNEALTSTAGIDMPRSLKFKAKRVSGS